MYGYQKVIYLPFKIILPLLISHMEFHRCTIYPNRQGSNHIYNYKPYGPICSSPYINLFIFVVENRTIFSGRTPLKIKIRKIQLSLLPLDYRYYVSHQILKQIIAKIKHNLRWILKRLEFKTNTKNSLKSRRFTQKDKIQLR